MQKYYQNFIDIELNHFRKLIYYYRCLSSAVFFREEFKYCMVGRRQYSDEKITITTFLKKILKMSI